MSRIVGVEVHELLIPFRLRFRHAAHARDKAEHLVVEVTLEGGAKGYGEILPRAYVTGETVATALADARELWAPALKTLQLDTSGPNPPFAALAPLYEEADAQRKLASYSGFDVAVFNAWAAAAGITLATALGTAATPPPLRVAPIGIGFPPRLAAHIARLFRLRAFKIKVGDAKGLERVLAVYAHAPKDASFVLDANRALHELSATALLAALRLADVRLDAFEEPLASGDPLALARLEETTGVPVMADESLVTRADAALLLRHRAASWWNLRLAKNGGFSGLRALAALARPAGLTLQLGALVGETGITEAASDAALALLGPVRRRESSYPRWLLKEDPAPGGKVSRAKLARWTRATHRLF